MNISLPMNEEPVHTETTAVQPYLGHKPTSTWEKILWSIGIFSARKIAKNRAKKLERIIETEDLRLAEDLMHLYGKNSVLLADDYVRLEHLLEQKKGHRNFNNMLEEDNDEGARTLVNQWKENGTYAIADIKSFEERLYIRSEEGMYKYFVESSGNEKIKVGREYIERFSRADTLEPNSNHLSDVSEETFLLELDLLSNRLDKGTFERNYTYMIDVRDFWRKNSPSLEKGKGELSNILKNKSDEFLEKGRIKKVGHISIGSKVRTKINHWTDYSSSYLGDRNAAFPIGSYGKVIDLRNDVASVEFSECKSGRWQMRLKRCTLSKSINSADYVLGELILLSSYSSVETIKFSNAIDEIISIINRE